MIRLRDAAQIYDGADNGVDPQLRRADVHSAFAEHALAVGIDQAQLYVYPPTLAYMLVPITFFRISIASIIWKLINLAALVGTGLLLARLLNVPLIGKTCFAICAFMVLFRPSLECVYWGQITAVLILMIVAGMFFYSRDRLVLAMFLFALASAIKITPAIVIVPLIAWREWKALCYFALWTTAILASLWALSDGWLLLDYVRHVIPSMSSGRAILTNKSLESAAKIVSQAMHAGISPNILQNASNVLSAVVICFTGWRCRNAGDTRKPSWLKLEWMSLFWLLSCCLAPVSWRHAYVLAAPAVIALAKKAFDNGIGLVQILMVFCFLLSISSFGFDSFAISTGTVLFAFLAMLPPLLGTLVVLIQDFRPQLVES